MPESVRKVLGDNPTGPRDAATVRKIVADLARRAYRRPVTDKEVDELVGLIALVQKDGESFEEGLCLAIQRLLISPHFLFRVEKGPPLTPDPSPRKRGEGPKTSSPLPACGERGRG